MTTSPSTAILVVAAGRGTRVGSGTPKQYLRLGGRALLSRTLDALAALGAPILVVTHSDDAAFYAAAVADLASPTAMLLRANVCGGATRQESVRNGLAALAGLAPEFVLIHDGARPFPSPALLARARVAAAAGGAAVPGFLVHDTIKQVDEAGRIVATPQRAALRAVQTPQAFRFALIREAHDSAWAAGARDLTDDAAIAEWAGHAVHVFEGEPGNMKVTTPEDVVTAEARLIRDCPDVRMGQGYDVHAFGPGDHVWLGGLKVPHSKGLVGHSDADVLSHAITDALYGALGDGDIGSHFPPSDPQWKGADFLDLPQGGRRRGTRARRHDRAYRCHRGLRDAEGRAAPRRHPPAHRRGGRPAARPGRGQGDHVGTPRLHRSRGRHRHPGDRHDPPADRCAPAGVGMIGPEIKVAVSELLKVFKTCNLKIATAESCTGGLLSAALTSVSGSSAVVERGFVTYTNTAKIPVARRARTTCSTRMARSAPRWPGRWPRAH